MPRMCDLVLVSSAVLFCTLAGMVCINVFAIVEALANDCLDTRLMQWTVYHPSICLLIACLLRLAAAVRSASSICCKKT